MFGLSLSSIGTVALAAVVAFGVGRMIGDTAGATRVQAQWDRAKLEAKQDQAAARERAATHDVALTAARTRQDRESAAALNVYREELKGADKCSTGTPIGPAGLERLQQLAGERR